MVCDCGGKLACVDISRVKDDNSTLRKYRCKDCDKFSYSIEYLVEYNKQTKRLWNDNYRKSKKEGKS